MRKYGERHHKSKWPDAAVQLAREVADAAPPRCRAGRAELALYRAGYNVPIGTIYDWLSAPEGLRNAPRKRRRVANCASP